MTISVNFHELSQIASQDYEDFSSLHLMDGKGSTANVYFRGDMMPAARDMASVFEAHKNKSPLLRLLDLVLEAIDDPRSETLESLIKDAGEASAQCCDDCSKYVGDDLSEIGGFVLCKDCAEAAAERDFEMRQDALADQADAVRSAQHERALTEAGRGHLIGGAK